MGDRKDAYRVLVGKPKEVGPLKISMYRRTLLKWFSNKSVGRA
jgi:hypothetical protein